MNYEQKYNDLINRLREYRERFGNPLYKEIGEEFPEIAESEDERIRKNILALVKKHAVNHERCQMEAYLEKKKEQKPSDKLTLENPLTGEKVYEREIPEFMKGADPKDVEAIVHLTVRGWTVIAPGKEQQPVDLSEMMVYKEPYIPPVPTPIVADEQKPAEWSEEDKAFLKVAIAICNRYSHKDIADWLKSLPEKFILHPKQEWSEEDEKMVLFWNMYYEYKVDDWPNKDVVEHLEKFQEWLNNRLRSLRPHSHWKPSDEQMEALRVVLEHEAERMGSSYELSLANSLYEQLKAL